MSAASTSAAGAVRAARSGQVPNPARGVRRVRDKPITQGVLSIIPPLHPSAKQVKSVYLNAIPRTATATDVLHALRDNKLVSNDFSVKNITSSAISLPRSRQYSLTRQWHVSLPSNKDATAVHHAVRYDRGSSDPSSGGLFPGFFAPSFISPAQYTTDTGKQFRIRQREHQADMMAHAQKTRALRDGRESGQAGREQNDKWTLDDGVNFDGKGVLLVGMPLGAGRNDVKSLLSHRLFGEWKKEASQLGLLQSDDGITKLPASLTGGDGNAFFVMRFETAALAHRAVRKLNMTMYQPTTRLPDTTPRKYLLRAEIAN